VPVEITVYEVRQFGNTSSTYCIWCATYHILSVISVRMRSPCRYQQHTGCCCCCRPVWTGLSWCCSECSGQQHSCVRAGRGVRLV
jgi:hypothetical protein